MTALAVKASTSVARAIRAASTRGESWVSSRYDEIWCLTSSRSLRISCAETSVLSNRSAVTSCLPWLLACHSPPDRGLSKASSSPCAMLFRHSRVLTVMPISLVISAPTPVPSVKSRIAASLRPATASRILAGGSTSHASDTMWPRHCATKKGSRGLGPLKSWLRMDITTDAIVSVLAFRQLNRTLECLSRNSLTCCATSRLSGRPTETASTICRARWAISESWSARCLGPVTLSSAASTTRLDARARTTPDEASARQPSLAHATSRWSVRTALKV
mmetsp:Transcript_9325/g.32300  ORF Transcript_9325/g.32300 Transcript_9325/m.32300 type:complete len:276 (-) Transcript_9325:4601-5428(-)